MVHVAKKSPWASVAIAVVCLFCVTTVACSGFSFASRQSSAGSGSGTGGGGNPPPPTSTISGSITPASLGAGITVNLTGAETAETTTDASGNYSFSGLPSGTYTVTPVKSGLVAFSPGSLNITTTGSPISGANFIASEPSPTTTISGSITPATLGSGIRVNLSGAGTASATTDSSGNYTLSGLSSGTYTVTPVQTGLVFSPASLNITITGSPISGANFIASEPSSTTTISGSITPATLGSGITVNLSGADTASTTTDSSGNYTFSGLSSGTYTVTPDHAGLVFSPAALSVTLSGSPVTGEDFAASAPLTPSGPIVIDGENGTVIKGLKITSTSGDCVSITNSTNITILNSEIGPCAGNAVRINGGTGISIYDSYIHPETQSPGCCDHNDGVFAYGNPSSLFIQGNVIAYSESNIEVQGATTVYVIGNLLLNPRGPYPRGENFQCWSNCSSIFVQNNYALSSIDTTQYLYPEATEDSINFGMTDTALIQGNFITGGHSVSGCGIMADTYSNAGTITHNLLLNTGVCGIGITDGTHTADSNRVYNTNPVTGGGNTAMYVAHYGQSSVCGPITVTNNIADEIRSDGYHSGWWNPGSCGTIDISTDVFGAAADPLLTPVTTVFVPPLIPPQPKNCVVISPYSTQNSAAACVP